MTTRLFLLLLPVFLCSAIARADDGVLPIGDDGKPINTDFETGDLRDWTITSGDAFVGQPIKGDTINARRAIGMG